MYIHFAKFFSYEQHDLKHPLDQCPDKRKNSDTNSDQLRSALSGDLSFVPRWYGSSVPTSLSTTCWDPLQLPSTIDYSQLACSGSSLATQVESRIWRLTRLMNLQAQYSCFFWYDEDFLHAPSNLSNRPIQFLAECPETEHVSAVPPFSAPSRQI